MTQGNAPVAQRGSPRRWLLVIVGLALSGCSEPWGPLAGGELAGQPLPAPAAWEAVPRTVQLETRPADPYSVNLWAVQAGEALYVAGDQDGKRWISHVRADGNVRLRIEGAVYALGAVEVDAADERRQVAAAFASKYRDDDDEGADFMANDAIFRLQLREGSPNPPSVAVLRY